MLPEVLRAFTFLLAMCMDVSSQEVSDASIRWSGRAPAQHHDRSDLCDWEADQDDGGLETNGQALLEAMRLTPGTLHICLEACKHPIGSRSCGFHGGPEPSRSNSEAGDTFAVRPRSPGHAVGGVDTRLLLGGQ
jgi:hypothetical protein